MLPLDLTAAVLTWLRAHEAGRLLRVQKLPASEFDALTATVRQVGERDERARFGGIGLSITDAKALLRRRFAYKEELLGSIDRLNNSGWTMLMVKVARKSPPDLVAEHEDEVRALIAAGADVNFAPAQSRCASRDPRRANQPLRSRHVSCAGRRRCTSPHFTDEPISRSFCSRLGPVWTRARATRCLSAARRSHGLFGLVMRVSWRCSSKRARNPARSRAARDRRCTSLTPSTERRIPSWLC